MTPVLKNPILLAVVGAAHGLKGEVRVKTFTGEPEALGDYGPLLTKDGRPLTVASVRPAKNVAIARFQEVATREAAEALGGQELFVDRSALPEAGEDEFYHSDLIGLEARDETGAILGKVMAIHDFGGGEIVEIGRGRGSIMVPFTRAAVPDISLDGGYLTVDSASAGLTGDGEAEPGDAG